MEVIEERCPFFGGNLQILLRLGHRAAGVLLRATRGPAHHLGDKLLEPRLGDPMVGLVDPRIGVEPRVDHDALDKVVDHRSDGINSPDALIEGRRVRFRAHSVLLRLESRTLPQREVLQHLSAILTSLHGVVSYSGALRYGS